MEFMGSVKTDPRQNKGEQDHEQQQQKQAGQQSRTVTRQQSGKGSFDID